MAVQQGGAEAARYPLACARCARPGDHPLRPGWQDLACRRCGARLVVLFAKVRGSRSRRDTAGNRRAYDTRVVYGGTEELVEFAGGGGEEFEMRSGDEVAFVLFRGRLHLLYNFTLRRCLRLRRRPAVGWVTILAVLAAAALALAVAVLWLVRR